MKPLATRIRAGYPGLFGNATDFDRETLPDTLDNQAWLQSTTTESVPAGPFSIHGWVKLRAAGGWTRIIAKMLNADSSGSAPDVMAILVELNTNRWFFQASGGNFTIIQGTQEYPIPYGVWAHIAATWSAGTVTLYLNGVPAYSQSTITQPDAGAGPWLIGGGPFLIGSGTDNQTVSALMCDWRVETVERSAAYLDALYRAAMGIPT